MQQEREKLEAELQGKEMLLNMRRESHREIFAELRAEGDSEDEDRRAIRAKVIAVREAKVEAELADMEYEIAQIKAKLAALTLAETHPAEADQSVAVEEARQRSDDAQAQADQLAAAADEEREQLFNDTLRKAQEIDKLCETQEWLAEADADMRAKSAPEELADIDDFEKADMDRLKYDDGQKMFLFHLDGLKRGAIADFDKTQAQLRHIISWTEENRSLEPADLIAVAVPRGFTQLEKRAVREAAEQAGHREVYLIEEIMAAALLAGLPVAGPEANLVVDIGQEDSEVAVIQKAGLVYAQRVEVGGAQMAEAALQALHKKYDLIRPNCLTSYLIKQELSFDPAPFRQYPATLTLKGRDTATGRPKKVTVDFEEIRQALVEPVYALVAAVRQTLERIPPEMAAEIKARGPMFTSHRVEMRRLEVLLREMMGCPVLIGRKYVEYVAIGAEGPLENLAALKSVSLQ
ncbi:hypothetical protein FACS189460_0840 [Deltaproteobacteria bacterium]|nr:hypothetical protein FACS189460_0840 [Deltaproteobacteria bacterium]